MKSVHVNLSLGCVHTITDSFWAATKIIPVWLLLTYKNGCGGAIFVTERSCPAPISKVESRISQARIQTGFHRFTEIGQIFHKKRIFNNNSSTFQVEIRKWSTGTNVFFFQFPGIRQKPGKGNFCMSPGFPRSLLPRPLV